MAERWERVYARIVPCEWDDQIVEFSLDLILEDGPVFSAFRVSKLELDLFPNLFGLVWERIIKDAEKYAALMKEVKEQK